jgi:hypothetical protein
VLAAVRTELGGDWRVLPTGQRIACDHFAVRAVEPWAEHFSIRQDRQGQPAIVVLHRDCHAVSFWRNPPGLRLPDDAPPAGPVDQPSTPVPPPKPPPPAMGADVPAILANIGQPDPENPDRAWSSHDATTAVMQLINGLEGRRKPAGKSWMSIASGVGTA